MKRVRLHHGKNDFNRSFPETKRKERDTWQREANKREEVRRIQYHLCQVRDLSRSAHPPMSSQNAFAHTLAGMRKTFPSYLPYVSAASEHCNGIVPCHL